MLELWSDAKKQSRVNAPLTRNGAIKLIWKLDTECIATKAMQNGRTRPVHSDMPIDVL